MPYKKHRQKQKKLNPHIWAWLNGEPQSEIQIDVFILNEDERKSLWNQNRDEILEAWILKRPGSRPALWWDYSSPRWLDDPWAGFPYHQTLQRPRQRLDTNSDILLPWQFAKNIKPAFFHGVPCSYFKLGRLHVPADELKKVYFESQASYLKRLNLFYPGEAERLTEKDLQPESAYQILEGIK